MVLECPGSKGTKEGIERILLRRRMCYNFSYKEFKSNISIGRWGLRRGQTYRHQNLFLFVL